MFRMEIFVDDRKLVAFLNAITGLVVSMTPPQPVVNVQENHSLKAASNGAVPSTIMAEIKKQKISEFTSADIKKALESMGKSAKSYNYVIGTFKQAKQIKMISRGRYRVL